MTWLDKAISWIAPQTGLNRSRARAVQTILDSSGPQNAYEGASRGRRTEGWRTPSTSANYEVANGMTMLRNRSHDLVRNNPYAARAVSVISTHTVGTGIRLQVKGGTKTATANMDAIIKDFLYTPAIDADGRNNVFGIQRLGMRSIPEGGEIILRRRRRQSSDGLPLPFQIQVLEGEFLDLSKTGVNSNTGGNIVNGIEYNGIGQRIAYWLFQEHPGENVYFNFGAGSDSVRVSAADVIHTYRMDRPGQMRGVPWTSPIIIRMRDFDEYQDAQLVRQKIAACFAGFIYDNEFGPAPGLPGGATQAPASSLVEKIEPGILELLPGGKRIEFADPPSVEGIGDVASIELHAIGSGIGVPYDLLTTDQSQVNFASGRLGRLAFYQDIDDWRSMMLIPHVCNGIWNWVKEAAEISGVSTKGMVDLWTPPRRPLTNPEKETAALRDRVRMGELTVSGMVRETGGDPEDHFAEMQKDAEMLDKRGLILDSDPRRTSRAGMEQTTLITEGATDEEETES